MLLTRRNILKNSAMAGSMALALPTAWVWAQPDGSASLQRLPKVALVMGNSGYRKVPVLANPANDARSIAQALERTGFAVTLKVDGDRADMAKAIAAYVHQLTTTKCVGLFYFAGHGLQLAWRNYLVPIDAMIVKADDVARQCVDVASLIDGLTRAANAMNVVILDACRENPFADDFRDAQKGLSQMDASPATILAYATAPGNVASDGKRANGLYTEHLLREMQVKGAKIEDVFKRVRLGVRRSSNGAQIPWESTSLEDDFYFVPPDRSTQVTDQQRQSDFREQLTQWERVKSTRDPAPLLSFLNRYPSGDFSELAQLRLDRVLAAQGERPVLVENAEANPFTRGSSVLDVRYRVGDSYSYRVSDPQTGTVTRTFTTQITEINDEQVVFDKGLVTDLQGNTKHVHDGREFTDNQNIPTEFAVGRQWSTHYTVSRPDGPEQEVDMNYVIATREPLTVPAGTFNAFVVEGTGTTTNGRGQTVEIHVTFWWDPQRVRRPLAKEERKQLRLAGAGRGGRHRRRNEGEAAPDRVRLIFSERQELVAYKQA